MSSNFTASDSTAYDPYRTPALPEGPPGGSTSGRPGWLTAVCVMCIVIGILGALNGAAGLVGALFGQQMQNMMMRRGGAGGGFPAEMQKVQEEFQAEMMAVQDKFFWGILASCILRMLVAAGLIYGGIVCLGLKAEGRQILLAACGAAILFEIGIVVLQSLINMEMMTAINAYLENVLQTMPQQPGGPPREFLLRIMKGSIIAGFVLQYVLIFIKIVFYLLCMLYLQRQSIKALFGQASVPAASLA